MRSLLLNNILILYLGALLRYIYVNKIKRKILNLILYCMDLIIQKQNPKKCLIFKTVLIIDCVHLFLLYY